MDFPSRMNYQMDALVKAFLWTRPTRPPPTIFFECWTVYAAGEKIWELFKLNWSTTAICGIFTGGGKKKGSRNITTMHILIGLPSTEQCQAFSSRVGNGLLSTQPASAVLELCSRNGSGKTTICAPCVRLRKTPLTSGPVAPHCPLQSGTFPSRSSLIGWSNHTLTPTCAKPFATASGRGRKVSQHQVFPH